MSRWREKNPSSTHTHKKSEIDPHYSSMYYSRLLLWAFNKFPRGCNNFCGLFSEHWLFLFLKRSGYGSLALRPACPHLHPLSHSIFRPLYCTWITHRWSQRQSSNFHNPNSNLLLKVVANVAVETKSGPRPECTKPRHLGTGTSLLRPRPVHGAWESFKM